MHSAPNDFTKPKLVHYSLTIHCPDLKCFGIEFVKPILHNRYILYAIAGGNKIYLDRNFIEKYIVNLQKNGLKKTIENFLLLQ
jgi:hypothetical protein